MRIHCRNIFNFITIFTLSFTIFLKESSGDSIPYKNVQNNVSKFEEATITFVSMWFNKSTCTNPSSASPEYTAVHPITDQKVTDYIVSVVLGSCLCFLLTMSYQNWKNADKELSKFGGPLRLPVVGNLYLLVCSRDEVLPRLGNIIEKHGRRFRFWIGNTASIFLLQANDLEKVLSSSKHVQKGKIYDLVLKWIVKDGLIAADSETWKVDRKLMNPSFKYQKFDGFLDSFNKHGKVVTKIVRDKLELNVLDEHLDQHFAMCTMDSILESTFGIKSDLQKNPNSEVLRAIISILESMRVRILKPWLTLPIIIDVFGRGKKEREGIRVMKEFVNTLAVQRNFRNEANELGNEITKPFIDVLMGRKSEKEIFDHMVTILSAGYETTATSMNYALYLLALHPEHLVKVHEELDRVFEEDAEVEVTFAHLAEIKYLEMCIKESLRLFPSAPVMTRCIGTDIKLDDDLVIPEGTEVVIDIYHVHRDPNVFPKPEKFDPERFLPEECASRSLYAYLPFSQGPRSCIGQKYALMQMKVVLSYILRSFTVSTPLKREDLKPFFGVVLQPNLKIPLKLNRRFS